MKGYFTSLAKQSGLQVSKEKNGPRVSTAPAEGPVHAPLDRVETVLIPPAREVRRTENAPGRKQTVKSREKTAAYGREKPAAADTRNAVTGEKKADGVREKQNVEPAKTETIFVEAPGAPMAGERTQPVIAPAPREPASEPAVEIITYAPREQASDPAVETIAPEPRDQASEPVVVETKFVGQDVNTASSPDVTDDQKPARTHQEPAGQSGFFVKTAEILEKGEAGPADIGSILFQEVREWVASGPEAAETRDPEAVETPAVREITQAAPEPGVVVIRERIEQERPGESPALEEQSFNLSIGTISVIIEDPEKPPDPVQIVQNERAQSAPAGSKREFSRLSRNYL